jgi:hypothetical protein
VIILFFLFFLLIAFSSVVHLLGNSCNSLYAKAFFLEKCVSIENLRDSGSILSISTVLAQRLNKYLAKFIKKSLLPSIT